jgi:hypothetical protein
MQPADDPRMRQALQARDWLAGRYLHLPEVTLIDIGYQANGRGSQRDLVVRVHVKDQAAAERLHLPGEANGVPVQVVIANYQLES